MILRLLSVFISLLALAAPASAHRLDEYLLASTIDVSATAVTVRLTLTPGTGVASQVIATIDLDRNGHISSTERARYVERVQSDLRIRIDGQDRPLRLVAASFPEVGPMRHGVGEIVLTFAAAFPFAVSHDLEFVNRHQSAVAVNLVNTLVPRDPAIRVVAQERSFDQSSYRLHFSSVRGGQAGISPEARGRRMADAIAIVRTYFWHGAHHILTGYDHLLFLAALVLGATTLWDLVKVVTAFTVAHTLTLTVAATGFVTLLDGIVEPVIAASIVAVAAENILSPAGARGTGRLGIASLFGLFHGFGFAAGILEIMHRMPGHATSLAILGFSLGVEAGNQLVLIPLYAGKRAVAFQKWPNSDRRLRAIQCIGSVTICLAALSYLVL